MSAFLISSMSASIRALSRPICSSNRCASERIFSRMREPNVSSGSKPKPPPSLLLSGRMSSVSIENRDTSSPSTGASPSSMVILGPPFRGIVSVSRLAVAPEPPPPSCCGDEGESVGWRSEGRVGMDGSVVTIEGGTESEAKKTCSPMITAPAVAMPAATRGLCLSIWKSSTNVIASSSSIRRASARLMPNSYILPDMVLM
mmetsp:Transcript_49724/g.124724  ORF Transcript_49724/g.124724 Transcript_49724/m.124724 type:complete len:201 (+) Transcript_49724:181-783(+)